MTKQTCRIVQIQANEPILLNGLDRLYRAFALEEEHIAPPEHFVEFVTPRLDDPTMLVALALNNRSPHNNQAVGYALAFDVIEHPFIPNWERTGYVTQLFVDQEHRRLGLGQQLVDYSMSWLTQRGVTQVMLNVDVDNDGGERFWQTAGFTPFLTRMKRSL